MGCTNHSDGDGMVACDGNEIPRPIPSHPITIPFVMVYHPITLPRIGLENKPLINWSMVIPEKAAPVTGTDLKTTGPVREDSRQ